MQMKIFLVALCVFIFPAVRSNNVTKPTFPNSSQNESTEDDIQVNESVDSGPGDDVIQNLYMEITGESPGFHSQDGPDCNNANNPQLFSVPNQTRGERNEGRSSYKRVFVGRNSSGSEIYTSSQKMKHAVALAESIRVVGAGLEIVKNRTEVQAKDRSLADSLCKLSTKHERNSTNLHGKRTVSTRKGDCFSLECEDSLMSLSRQMLLNPELRSAYEDYMSSHREALNMLSLNERELLEDIFRSTDLERPGPSGLRKQSDALKPQVVRTELSPNRPFGQEVNSESPNFTPDQDASILVAQYNYGPEARIDNSLNSFVAAVNALLTLVEDLDVYFGSARRLRTSLLQQPQESFNILEEMSSRLRIMIMFSRPLGVSRLGADSENRLIDVADSVMYVNEEIFSHIIDFRNNVYRDDDRRLIEYLVAIIREFRNEISAVLQSAQHVIEYFQDLLNV